MLQELGPGIHLNLPMVLGLGPTFKIVMMPENTSSTPSTDLATSLLLSYVINEKKPKLGNRAKRRSNKQNKNLSLKVITSSIEKLKHLKKPRSAKKLQKKKTNKPKRNANANANKKKSKLTVCLTLKLFIYIKLRVKSFIALRKMNLFATLEEEKTALHME
ncbi:hypothetical protein C0J52_20995 [Blattella germanica]|nr:hypothetical protein C0J52_20995 [Blattella germanica]